MLTPLFVLAAMQSAATNGAVESWTNCLVREVERTHGGSSSTDVVVNSAMRVCASQELAVRRGVERDFGDRSAAEVSAELDKLNGMTRAEIRKAVVRLRGQAGAVGRPAAPPAARPAAPRPVAAAGQRLRRPLQFFNKCHYPVRYFIYHIGADKTWRTHGWYTAPAGQLARGITDSGGRPVYHLEGENLFSYAETTGPTYVNWRGAQPVTFGGARYSLQKSSLSVVNGAYQFGLSCTGR